MPALSTTASFGFGNDTERLLRAYHRLGCASCQYYRNTDNEPGVGEALRVVERAGLVFDSVHGVFDHCDPSSEDSGERERALGIYESEGRLALELGGAGVVVHPAPRNEGRRVMPLVEAEEAQCARWPALKDFLARLAEVGERLGVTYWVENQPMDTPIGHDPVELAEVVRGVGSGRVGMCFDTGHAWISCRARGVDFTGVVRLCTPEVGYWHVHDNDGREDDHRMIGEGTLDWGALTGVLRGGSAVRGTGERGEGGKERGRGGGGGGGGGAVRMLELFHDAATVEGWAEQGWEARLREVLCL